ncbi:hypothetical protein ACFOWA_07245 [Pedobacter lithocola]|uniref:Uncharacterized protein n=1 Tax=Pedobacter lithocola TaxID=1908239 RepID=A0ABV8P8J7_9SPHI
MSDHLLSILFQIIGALGALATIGAFIAVFRRDKDKQAQIEKLANIATILKAQNESIKKQNELVQQEIDIFKESVNLKAGDQQAIIAIEEKKLKLSVQPNLWLNGAGYKGYDGELSIDLNNKGEDAKLLEFNLTSDDIVLHSLSLPWDLDKGERRNIYGRRVGEKHIKDAQYEIDVVYEDRLHNKYMMKIKGTGNSVKIVDTKEI